MKELLFVLAALVFLGAAVAEEIEPGEDVLMKDADGQIVPIFSIPAWLNDVTFANPVDYENGTAVIGGAKVKPAWPN